MGTSNLTVTKYSESIQNFIRAHCGSSRITFRKFQKNIQGKDDEMSIVCSIIPLLHDRQVREIRMWDLFCIQLEKNYWLQLQEYFHKIDLFKEPILRICKNETAFIHLQGAYWRSKYYGDISSGEASMMLKKRLCLSASQDEISQILEDTDEFEARQIVKAVEEKIMELNPHLLNIIK